MMKEQFRSEFAELLGLIPDNLVESLNLEENNWDSLTVVSTIALVDEHYGVAIDGKSLSGCVTFGELQKIILEKARN